MRYLDPLGGEFVYLTWSIDLRLRGPFVLPSASRRQQLRSMTPRLRELQTRPGVRRTRLLEATFIAPMPGHPSIDTAVIVDGKKAVIEVRRWLDEGGLPQPTQVLSAHNSARFGDTDGLGDPILLNHFVGSAPTAAAEGVWRQASQWYEKALGVSNSTLLTFEPPSPFVVMNYASVPGPVPKFMAGQLLRPSFYPRVAQPLARTGVRPCPVFARRVA